MLYLSGNEHQSDYVVENKTVLKRE